MTGSAADRCRQMASAEVRARGTKEEMSEGGSTGVRGGASKRENERTRERARKGASEREIRTDRERERGRQLLVDATPNLPHLAASHVSDRSSVCVLERVHGASTTHFAGGYQRY